MKTETTDPPVFFVSYAHADAEYKEDRDNLRKFVEDLSARVAGKMPTPLEGVSFIDPNMQVGEVWSESLGDALKRSRVGVALYSPNYFTRQWCGKEFQVLLDRSRSSQGGTGIVPVRWDKFLNPPKCAARIQYDSGAFPPEYASMGMGQLARLRPAFLAAHDFALTALAERIVAEAKAERLKQLDTLDFDGVKSAWEEEVANDPQSHTQGKISKTCFVFISRDGWGWAPYEGTPAQIGALAQKISGELGIKYEEIPCNDSLPLKLEEANAGDVPTVLFADPDSLNEETYARPMRRYDRQYLLNCATLVAWQPEAKGRIEADPNWIHLKTRVFKQKIKDPPRYHELQSIFSRDDLVLKTRMLIEQIRSGRMNRLMSDPNTPAMKATDQALTESAAALGINTASPPHLESSSNDRSGRH